MKSERPIIEPSEINAKLRIAQIDEEVKRSRVTRKYESMPLQPRLQMSTSLQRNLSKYQE